MTTSYKYLSFIFLLLFIFQSLNADALTNTPLNDYRKSLNERMGASFTLNNSSFKILIDKKKMEAYAIPRLTASGMVPWLTKDNIENAPTRINGMLSLTVTAIILSHIYEETHTDSLYVQVYTLTNNQEQLLYSFDLNQKIYKKIDWDNTSPNDFIRLVHNFTWSSWYVMKAQNEVVYIN